MGFPRAAPLSGLKDFADFDGPDPDDERLCRRIHEQTERCDDPDTFLVAGHRDTLWEKANMLVGMEQMMEYFYAEAQRRSSPATCSTPSWTSSWTWPNTTSPSAGPSRSSAATRCRPRPSGP